MYKITIEKPRMRLAHRFLLWAYKSGKKPDTFGNDRRGHSPLDIPGRTVLLSFIMATILAILIGNVWLETIHFLITFDDLPQIEENHIQPDSTVSMSSVAIVAKLLPDWKPKIREANKNIKNALQNAFYDNKVSIDGIARLVFDTTSVKVEDRQAIARHIVGELERGKWTLWMIPYFNPQPPDRIADEFGLYEQYEEEGGEISKATWRRFITMSSIQFIRDQLDSDILHYRRHLSALGGGIQWITFIAALWCLIMLVALRMPWARIQNSLAVNNHLPWHSEESDCWDIGSLYFKEIDDSSKYQSMFIAPRLVKEVLNVKESDSSVSIYETIRHRVGAFRESVDVGEYEIINFLIWATPTFGFIGTIFGIISAMENASAIFSAVTSVEQGIALDQVSGALGTAFDTSFVALIMLVPMSFFLARTRKAEADFFEVLEFEAIGNLPEQLEDV